MKYFNVGLVEMAIICAIVAIASVVISMFQSVIS